MVFLKGTKEAMLEYILGRCEAKRGWGKFKVVAEKVFKRERIPALCAGQDTDEQRLQRFTGKPAEDERFGTELPTAASATAPLTVSREVLEGQVCSMEDGGDAVGRSPRSAVCGTDNDVGCTGDASGGKQTVTLKDQSIGRSYESWQAVIAIEGRTKKYNLGYYLNGEDEQDRKPQASR
ncbi:unnamed protein product [Scytosiphon promiscuus]